MPVNRTAVVVALELLTVALVLAAVAVAAGWLPASLLAAAVTTGVASRYLDRPPSVDLIQTPRKAPPNAPEPRTTHPRPITPPTR